MRNVLSLLLTVSLLTATAAVKAAPQFAPTDQAAVAPLARTITFCRDAESSSPDSAFNSYSPISAAFMRKIGKPFKGTIAEIKPYRVTLLQQPTHGEVQLLNEQSQHWTYAPERGYTGPDQVAYVVESQTKRYKVVINFWVVEVIDERRDRSECEGKKLGH